MSSQFVQHKEIADTKIMSEIQKLKNFISQVNKNYDFLGDESKAGMDSS